MKRAVIIRGVRTPFVKAFGEFTTLDTIALGCHAVRSLLRRTHVNPRHVDGIVWGGVVLPPASPNVGREIVLDLGLPREIEAATVTRACASGLEAITAAAAKIERGDAEIMIAGGSDSTSNAAVPLPTRFIQKLGPLMMGKRARPRDYVQALAQLNPLTDVLPRMPKVAERTTGEVMGEAAERMAERYAITRQEQDEFALRSHLRAAAAIESGRFSDEVTEVEVRPGRSVHTDAIVRGDSSLDQLSKLRPVFKRGGTITAGNSSPLTDGAAAVLLMSEERAHALGYSPLACLRAWSYVGVDPADQLLIGPALAIPKVLAKLDMELRDADFVDLHEAFAAQVLCVLKALGSRAFARERLGREAAVGQIEPSRLNVHGGSLAIGHPFAATGARMVTTMANELAQSGKRTAVLGICAAGGLGAAAVLERA